MNDTRTYSKGIPNIPYHGHSLQSGMPLNSLLFIPQYKIDSKQF